MTSSVNFDNSFITDMKSQMIKGADAMAGYYTFEARQMALGNRGESFKAFQTGQTANSFFFERLSSLVRKVANDAPWYNIIELGSRPHVIKAVNKKFLHFVIDGQDIFVKSVKHPGTSPNPILMITSSIVNDSRVLDAVQEAMNA